MFWKKPKSLGSILGTFTKTLADLDTLIKANDAKEKVNSAKIEALYVENNALIAEGLKAERVAEHINGLVA